VSPIGWTASAGRAWRLSTKAQWILMLATFFDMQSAPPPAGVVFVVVWFVFLAITDSAALPAPSTADESPRYSCKETV
jgi:hypothetical protein